MNLIELKNVSKSYETSNGIKEVLKNIKLNIKKGSFIILKGVSGSGKTTLMNIMSGIDNITSGELYFNGERIDNFDEEKLRLLRRNNMAFVFQKPNLIPNLTVSLNILMGKYLSSNSLDLDEVLALTNLTSLKDKYPSSLSGGECQRVSLARAIISNPLTLFLDEVTSEQDRNNINNIIELLEKINQKYQTTIIFSTHDNIKNHQIITIDKGIVVERN